EFAVEVLAEDVGSGDGGLILLRVTPQGGHQEHDRVLNAKRQLGHAALAVSQLELVLAHRAADFRSIASESTDRKVYVGGQARVAHRRLLPVASCQLLPQGPLSVCGKFSPQGPGM